MLAKRIIPAYNVFEVSMAARHTKYFPIKPHVKGKPIRDIDPIKKGKLTEGLLFKLRIFKSTIIPEHKKRHAFATA